MNRHVLIGVVAVAVVAGLVGVLVVRSPNAPPEQPRAESAPVKKAPAEKSTAEILLEREPEQPAPTSASKPRAARPPALPAESAPAAAPTTGTLHINSDVPGAEVFIDREFIGKTPVTANGVKPGSRRLNVVAEGYDGIADTLEVTPGERSVTVRFREVRLDAAVDVVHKHRMGSCKGRLVATPAGLRYETSEKDDAFTAALTELEVFQIDYLDKNLKIKPKKGKQYNFTDPQGNADRLFVFHRDVEKARERLKKGDPPAAR